MRPHSLLGCSGRFGQAGQHQRGLEGTSEPLRSPGSHGVPYLLATVNDCPCRSGSILTPCSQQLRNLFFNYLSNRSPQSLQTCLNRPGNFFVRTLMMPLKPQSWLEKGRTNRGCKFVREKEELCPPQPTPGFAAAIG